MRPTVEYPIEIYTKEQIKEFKIGDILTNEEAKKLQRKLKDASK